MPIDGLSSSLEASISDPAPHPATDGPSRAQCDGFAIVWDSAGGALGRCRDWASLRGGTELWAAAGVAAFCFRRGGHAPTMPAALTSWDSPRTSGVFLGELYRLERDQAAKASSSQRPEPDRAVDGASTGTGIDGQVVGAASRPRSVDAPAPTSDDSVTAPAVPPAADPAALIPTAYAAWGDGLFDRLEGVYCLALWDHERRSLLLYRDASCGNALYWFDGGDWAAVATRLEVLTDLPGAPQTIAPSGLHEYLRFLDVSPPNTIYAGICAVEPGLLARFSGSGLDYAVPSEAARAAQTAPRASTRATTPSFDACVDALDTALRDSIAARLDRGRTTGVFLSGGIDSALLGAIAASIDREAIDAFTVGFDEHGFDERPVAAAIASHLGVRHHAHAYDMATYLAAFDDFVASIDLPFADPAGLPTLLLYRDCRQVVDAVLDGTGADTLLGVMPARHLRISTQYAARLPCGIRHLIATLLRRVPGAAGYAPVLDFDAPEDLLIRWKGWTREEIAALTGAPVDFRDTRFFRVYRRFAPAEHFERYSALLGNLPDDRVHQAAEVTGLKVRFPYWDRGVEQLIRNMPRDYRYTEAEPKRLLRALLGRYVPRSLWDLPKHGFDFPFVALLQYDGFALARRYLDGGLLKRYGLVEARMVDEYAKAFQAGDNGLGFRIWALVVLFAWLEHHQADLHSRHLTPGTHPV
jgi:asparagine synthase (glutamine-hydrolysing)